MAFSFPAKMAAACAAALAASVALTGGMARGEETSAAKGGLSRNKIEISGSATGMANMASSLGAMRPEPGLLAQGVARTGSLPPEGNRTMATRPNDRGLAPGPSTIAGSIAVTGSTPATLANAGSNTMARSVPVGGGASQPADIAVAPTGGVTALSGNTGQTLQRMNADQPLGKSSTAGERGSSAPQ